MNGTGNARRAGPCLQPEGSGGLIPPINEIQVRYASLAGLRNAMSRALRHGAVHPQGGQLRIDGHLSMARVEAIDPSFAEAARRGVRWKVICMEVLDVNGVSERATQARKSQRVSASSSGSWP